MAACASTCDGFSEEVLQTNPLNMFWQTLPVGVVDEVVDGVAELPVVVVDAPPETA